jgi:hypothetical protein
MTDNNEMQIRPECLRAADDFWVAPTGDEVREVLRRAGLSGSKAMRLLGMKSSSGRSIRRYTGNDAPIPYPSWAILCEVAGLGKIWSASPSGEAPDVAEEGIDEVDADMAWSHTKELELVKVLSQDASAKAFLHFWRGTAHIEPALATIDGVIKGKTSINDSAISECRAALIRLRQLAYAISQLESEGEYPPEVDEAVRTIVQRYNAVLADAQEKVRIILQWTEHLA